MFNKDNNFVPHVPKFTLEKGVSPAFINVMYLNLTKCLITIVGEVV